MRQRKNMFTEICVLVSIICLLFCGCAKENVSDSKKGGNIGLHKKWLFYNEVRGEFEVLRLKKDGSFSYNCSCGEEVEDFDVYDTYEYDKEKKQLIVYGADIEDKHIDILSMNEYHLMLRINGKIKDFIIEEEDLISNFYSFEGEKHFSGYNSKCAIVDIKGDKVTYGPINYDREGIYKDGPFENFTLAENPKFYEVSVQSYNSIQGDSEYEEFYEVEKREIPEKDIEEFIDYGTSYSYVWFDDDLKVKKIVFFGHTSVTADFKAVTIPKEYSEDITKEYLEKEIEEGIYDAAHINEDGSVLYLMLKEQQDKILKDKKQIYLNSLDEMCGEDNYGIKEIKANKNFTKYEVIMSKDMKKLPKDVKENLEHMGKMYNAYKGKDVEEIKVKIDIQHN